MIVKNLKLVQIEAYVLIVNLISFTLKRKITLRSDRGSHSILTYVTTFVTPRPFPCFRWGGDPKMAEVFRHDVHLFSEHDGYLSCARWAVVYPLKTLLYYTIPDCRKTRQARGNDKRGLHSLAYGVAAG